MERLLTTIEFPTIDEVLDLLVPFRRANEWTDSPGFNLTISGYYKFNGDYATWILPQITQENQKTLYYLINKTNNNNAVRIEGQGGNKVVVGSIEYDFFNLAPKASMILYQDGGAWMCLSHDNGSIETFGTFVGDGNGPVTISIPHRLSRTPTWFLVFAESADAKPIAFTSVADDTNIVLTLASASPGGTNNMGYKWIAKL